MFNYLRKLSPADHDRLPDHPHTSVGIAIAKAPQAESIKANVKTIANRRHYLPVAGR
jgi:hypothetical protein